MGEPFAPEQPLVLTPLRPRDQRRHQTLPSPLSQPSFQPRDQSSHRPLPFAPQQRPLLARPLSQDQAPALATLKPSLRPPPQSQDQHQPLCLLLTLPQAALLFQHPEQLLLLPLQQLLLQLSFQVNQQQPLQLRLVRPCALAVMYSGLRIAGAGFRPPLPVYCLL